MDEESLLRQSRFMENNINCSAKLRKQRDDVRTKALRMMLFEPTPRVLPDPVVRQRLNSLPQHRSVPSPRTLRPPFFNPPVDIANELADELVRPSHFVDAKRRPKSAHTARSILDWRKLARCTLPQSTGQRVHTDWGLIDTGQPWTMVHPAPTLFSPTSTRRSLPNRPALLVNDYGMRRPFVLAGMPSGVSTRASDPQGAGQLGWVR